MLNWIITASMNNRLAVLGGVLVLIAAGVSALASLNVDAFPDTTPIQVQINTVAPSMVPEEVEKLITFPVELSLGGLPGLQQVRSISQFGLSQAVVTFEDGTNIYFARQQIAERLSGIEMPPGIPRPEMGPVSTGLGEVFHFTIKPKDDTEQALTEARTTLDWRVKPELRQVPGTAEINSWGGLKKQYQVLLNPDKLSKHDLHFDEFVAALKANNVNVGAGSINRRGDMLLVHGVGRTTNVEQIKKMLIAAEDGVPIRLEDIGEVVIGHEIRRGVVTANGQGEVALGLGFMRMGENSYNVTQRLADRFDRYVHDQRDKDGNLVTASQLPEGLSADTVYDRTKLVDKVIATVRKNLAEGALLVVAILFVFLGNLRAGLIVASAIPLSMLFAFLGMSRAGIAGSLLSLGALDFGLVVDGAVVTIENVVRRLSHNASGRERFDVIRDACCEVAKPGLFGVLIIMIVYLPIVALEGVEGKLFRPMALTVVFALAGSLLMTLTVIPVLASLMLPKKMDETEPLLVRGLALLYRPMLATVMARPTIVLGATAIMLVVALSVALRLGGEFVPRLNEGSIVIGIIRPPGTSLEQSIKINTEMEKMILREFPGEVERCWTRQGAPEVATDPGTIESTDIFIMLKAREAWKKIVALERVVDGVKTTVTKRVESQEELVEALSKEVDKFPGQIVFFTQPIEMRINEMISGVRADVAVKLFGKDLDTLTAKGREIEEVLRSIPGAADLTTEQIKGQPVLRVKIDEDKIARYGISRQGVLDLVESIGGKVVSEIIEDELRFPLAIRLPPELRTSPDTIANMTLPTISGERVPLSRVAAIEEIVGARVISREWSERRITVQCNIRGRDMAGFVQDAQQEIAKRVELGKGYRIEWGGQFENLQRATNRLKLVVPIAMVLIIVMLYMTFANLFDSMLVFTSVPFACIGGVITLFVRGMPFSISAAVGFIALSGIAVLNSLVLVEFIRHLRAEGRPLHEAIFEAAVTRLRPVLMTATVASLGFVPMALSSGMGAEVQRPLASVVIGGVISSTFMTLLVLPTLYEVASLCRLRFWKSLGRDAGSPDAREANLSNHPQNLIVSIGQ
jgi:cobalt-zinc-cadmium resistance protein CzcA